MKKAQDRFWDFHYVGFGSAPVAIGGNSLLLDARGWEAVCSPASSGTETLCWFVENEPDLRNGRKVSPPDYSRQGAQQQRKAVMRDVQEAFRNGRWGRFVAFNPGGRYGRLRAYMYLRPDGTGYFRGVYWGGWLDEKPVDFVWNPAELGLRNEREILTAPIVGQEARWEEFCRRLLDEQIAIATRENLIDQPLRYLRGSEAELKRVTTWICHCHDDPATLYAAETAEVVYVARMEDLPAGPYAIDAYNVSFPYIHGDMAAHLVEISYGSPPCPSHLKTLLDLAFQYNTFEGHTWSARGKEAPEVSCRREDWVFHRALCRTTVVRPSAHERAESLLCLFDWLEGKVSPEERRVLLRLDEQA